MALLLPPSPAAGAEVQLEGGNGAAVGFPGFFHPTGGNSSSWPLPLGNLELPPYSLNYNPQLLSGTFQQQNVLHGGPVSLALFCRWGNWGTAQGKWLAQDHPP